MFTLPPLPYGFDALSPAIDRQGVMRHYCDNHAGYVKKLNELAPPGMSLEQILATAPLNSPLYNNAAQHWAHMMWWDGMRPPPMGGQKPTGMAARIIKDYGAFKKEWVEKGGALFGSGWVWLTLDRSGSARVIALPNAVLPQRHDGSFPIMVSDLWEHAYYCQYGTKRKDYLARFFDVVCWQSVNDRIAAWQAMR